MSQIEYKAADGNNLFCYCCPHFVFSLSILCYFADIIQSFGRLTVDHLADRHFLNFISEYLSKCALNDGSPNNRINQNEQKLRFSEFGSSDKNHHGRIMMFGQKNIFICIQFDGWLHCELFSNIFCENGKDRHLQY